MGKLQVIVTVMHEKDAVSYYKKMNLQSDALFANQSDEYSYTKETVNGHSVEMITTATRGLSLNRNIGINYSSPEAEYILFSDNDLEFCEDYEKLVCEEFEAHPEAEAIKFFVRDLSNTKNEGRITDSFLKAKRRSVTGFGVVGLAVKRKVLLTKNLFFNETFGAGSENFCGEDTIFMQELIKKGVKFYLSPIEVAQMIPAESTWREGRTEKYFTVAGSVLAATYPRLATILALRSAYRFSKREGTNMSFKKIFSCYRQGIKKQLKGR